jgi:hypothetical protein
MLVKALHHICLKHINHYFLPESEENSNFDSKKLQQGGVRT